MQTVQVSLRWFIANNDGKKVVNEARIAAVTTEEDWQSQLEWTPKGH